MNDIRLTNYNMASARLIGGLLFTPLLAAVFIFALLNFSLKNLTTNPEEILIAVIAPLGAFAFGWMALTAVTSLTIGGELVVGTIFGSKHYPLGDIGSIGFSTETTKIQGALPLAQHLMMHIDLRSGEHVQVKVNQSEAQQVISSLAGRGMEALFQDQAA